MGRIKSRAVAQREETTGKWPGRITRILALGILVPAALQATPAHGAITTRVSVGSATQQGNGASSGNPKVSADGRFVVFQSYATNLVGDDNNSARDVFVRDVHTGRTARVSISSSGMEGDSSSGDEYISPNGRYVTFSSYASNLVPNDTNNRQDVFVHDLQLGLTARVSVSSSGEQGDGSSYMPSISDDGRYVAFASYATNLAAGPPGPAQSEIYLHDRDKGQTMWIGTSMDGQATNSRSPRISGDGRAVTFNSSKDNLVPDDTNNVRDVFVHDVDAGLTTRISVHSSGQEGNGSSGSTAKASPISADGRYVAFASYASNLVDDDTNDQADVFVHDRLTDDTWRVSVGPEGEEGNHYSRDPSISADGRYVAFSSLASNLMSEGHAYYVDVYIRDLHAQTTTLITYPWLGTYTDNVSASPFVSSDGRYVVFASHATNLVPVDTNEEYDLFIRDRGGEAPGQARLLYVDDDAPPGGDGLSWQTAHNDLQAALLLPLPGTTVRLAEGIYTPTPPDGPREAAFRLFDGLTLEGGYAGIASSTPDERDIAAHETVLTGDVEFNDDGLPFSDCCMPDDRRTGCDESPCEAAVCAVASSCCASAWGADCVDLALTLCGALCTFNDDNSYHVVVGTDCDSATTLDGVTIRGGNADGNSSWPFTDNSSGGGLYAIRGSLTVKDCKFVGNWAGSGGAMSCASGSNGTLTHCTFTGNSTSAAGGAIDINSSSPTVTGCAFYGNTSRSAHQGFGGAISTNSGNPVIARCLFDGNSAAWAGAMDIGSDAHVIDCVFIGNTSDANAGAMSLGGYYGECMVTNCRFIGNVCGQDGGAIEVTWFGDPVFRACVFIGNQAERNGGGVYINSSYDSQATYESCLFNGNVANAGGGIYTWSSDLPVAVSNCTFSSNLASQSYGGGIYNRSQQGMDVTSSVLWGNSGFSGNTERNQFYDSGGAATVRYSCVEGLNSLPGEGNIDDDPLFVDSAGMDAVPGTEDDNLRLSPGSPCGDTGDPAHSPEAGSTDLDGHSRVLCERVDMGSYEFGVGDYNCDQTVNLADFAPWEACMTGPHGGPYDAGCEAFDVDADGYVDLSDFAGFLSTFNGTE